MRDLVTMRDVVIMTTKRRNEIVDRAHPSPRIPFCRRRPVLTLFALPLLLAVALAQRPPQTLVLPIAEDLRGVSVVSTKVIWASGSHGAYLRTTDAGHTWQPANVPDAANLDFRGIVAFSADEAFLMSSGPADQSRIYHTSDGGQHWSLQFTNSNPKGFFDSMAFWDPTHGVVLGDPTVPGDQNTGPPKFEVLLTEDGKTWHSISAQLPPALEGEAAFAASNSCLSILHNPAALDPNIWFATGAATARVYHSPDRGQTWQVADTPIVHGSDSTGIFSIAFRDPLHGVIAGGDYKHPQQDGPNLAFTNDGGKTWTLSTLKPQVYFSAVAYDRPMANSTEDEKKKKANVNKELKSDDGPEELHRLFLVNTDFLFDFHSPANPIRIDPPKNSGMRFNAVSVYPDGGAVFVGPKGSMISIP